MKFAWIDANRVCWPVETQCRVLSVARGGYYAWRRRLPGVRRGRRAVLLDAIRRVHVESRCIYGSPRVHRELEAQGLRCNVKTVARLMRENGLYSKVRRRFRVRTTDSRHGYRVASNVLDRRFRRRSANRAWVSDLTYVPTGEGWLYLAVVLDLYSRKVVGYSMGDRLKASLAMEALTRAVDGRGRGRLAGLVHHSDRGVQYACDAYRTLLRSQRIRASMSGRGDCYDNAVAESFFKTLKTELTHHERYATRRAAKESIAEYIERFYNIRRRHSTLGYRSPAEFERDPD